MCDHPALFTTTIDAVFSVAHRGRVLAFLAPPDLTLTQRSGVVRTAQGDMPYPNFEFVNRIDRRPCLAVIVPDTPAARLLQPGESISFHQPP